MVRKSERRLTKFNDLFTRDLAERLSAAISRADFTGSQEFLVQPALGGSICSCCKHCLQKCGRYFGETEMSLLDLPCH